MAVENGADEVSGEHSLEPRRVAELLQDGDVDLVDVREDDEWESGRVPGARHVPILEVTAQAETIDRERLVIFYCRGGNRSAMVAEAFALEGFDAHNMSGGIKAWAEAGLGLEPRGGSVA
jgi:rhodanese-related sulfurtransferase